MSGGVDSSVAALLLKKEGHQLLGLHMKLHHGEGHERIRKRVFESVHALLHDEVSYAVQEVGAPPF